MTIILSILALALFALICHQSWLVYKLSKFDGVSIVGDCMIIWFMGLACSLLVFFIIIG